VAGRSRSSVVSRFNVRRAALPIMERIHEETGETTFLCVPRGDEAVCIERIDGKQVNLLALSLGVPIFDHTGTVKASLSIGGLREPILGEGSPVLALARDAAAEISRTLGHDQTTS
jgi:DNA-binding IclR family transcriptional regulator